MARTCPNTKKIVPHPFEKEEKVPAQYHLGTIKMLHFSFEAETGVKCSLKSFRQNILFMQFTQIQMIGVGALANLTKDTSFHWDDRRSFKCIDGLIERMKATNIDKTIIYNKCQSGSFSTK